MIKVCLIHAKYNKFGGHENYSEYISFKFIIGFVYLNSFASKAINVHEIEWLWSKLSVKLSLLNSFFI